MITIHKSVCHATGVFMSVNALGCFLSVTDTSFRADSIDVWNFIAGIYSGLTMMPSPLELVLWCIITITVFHDIASTENDTELQAFVERRCCGVGN